MDTPASQQAGAGNDDGAVARTIALLGNPNVGKTTLFNRLAGTRLKAANFPGTTQEAHVGSVSFAGGASARLIDLPGVYGLGLNQPEAEVARGELDGVTAPEGEAAGVPDALLVVVDATNLRRNLPLVAEALGRSLPTVVAVNMMDAARRRGISVDGAALSAELGCAVVPTSARTGEGVDELRRVLRDVPRGEMSAEVRALGGSGDEDGVTRWADDVYARVASATPGVADASLTDRLDRAFTHPVVGLVVFAAVMGGLFYTIFKLASYPMDWIDGVFSGLGGAARGVLPEGLIADMITDGAIAGVGATVIFLPQICILFFLISLLEHTGYLARAAFVIDRVFRPFGLSGHAFVPFLSSHACALPGIMAARTIPDRRDRLATILTAPFMSCTARIPVYVLLTVLLFPESPAMQTLAFAGCYVLGIAAGLVSALIARRTILRGASRHMALELPAYRLPDVRAALLATADRAWVFLKKAGVVILFISIVLWYLGEFPRSAAPAEALELRETARQVEESGEDEGGELALTLREQADRVEAGYAARRSALGRLGSAMQPVFEPLGYDRQLTIGVLASFAAREVFVSTMAVQVVGTEELEDEGLFEALSRAERDDGSALFDPATAWSLLVYYILAMQCLPTLAVTAREAGGARWAMLQLGWMQVLAYASAFGVYRVAVMLGGG